MYVLNIVSAIKKMPINEIRGFIFENYYKQIGFSKFNEMLYKKKICCCLKTN